MQPSSSGARADFAGVDEAVNAHVSPSAVFPSVEEQSRGVKFKGQSERSVKPAAKDSKALARVDGRAGGDSDVVSDDGGLRPEGKARIDDWMQKQPEKPEEMEQEAMSSESGSDKEEEQPEEGAAGGHDDDSENEVGQLDEAGSAVNDYVSAL